MYGAELDTPRRRPLERVTPVLGLNLTTGRLVVSFRPDSRKYLSEVLAELDLRASQPTNGDGDADLDRFEGADALHLPRLGIAVIQAERVDAPLEQQLLHHPCVSRVSPEQVVEATAWPSFGGGAVLRRPSRSAAGYVGSGLSQVDGGLHAAWTWRQDDPWHEDELTWGLQSVGVDAASSDGSGVRVAVLDGGVDRSHPDLAGRVVEERSFVRHPDAGRPDLTHGTHCAGIIAGGATPVRGPRYGVAPGAEILSARVLDSRLVGVDGDILAGMEWAVTAGCAIASISVSGRSSRQTQGAFEDAVQNAVAEGTVVVAAAGNSAFRRLGWPGRVEYPAGCPSAIAVGAVDRHHQIGRFSPRSGPAGTVTLVAPGVGVRSAWPGPDLTRSCDGTSAAAPFVAGVLACLVGSTPAVAADDLIQDLLARAVRPPAADRRDFGYGILSL